MNVIMVALVGYKSDGFAEDRFVLHSFSSLQNNQLLRHEPLFTSVIPNFESHILSPILALPNLHLVFITHTTPSLKP